MCADVKPSAPGPRHGREEHPLPGWGGETTRFIYIYIYITELRVSSILPCCIVPRRTALRASARSRVCLSAVLRLFMDFRGFDSSIILIITGEIIVSIEDFLESLSQAILVGIMLVGRLGVCLRSVLHHATRYCSAPYHTACHCL